MVDEKKAIYNKVKYFHVINETNYRHILKLL